MALWLATDGNHIEIYEAPSQTDAIMWLIEEYDIVPEEHDYVYASLYVAPIEGNSTCMVRIGEELMAQDAAATAQEA
jgi:hypothetical protein